MPQLLPRLSGNRAACSCTWGRPPPWHPARRHCGQAKCLWQKLVQVTATVLSEQAGARLAYVTDVHLLTLYPVLRARTPSTLGVISSGKGSCMLSLVALATICRQNSNLLCVALCNLVASSQRFLPFAPCEAGGGRAVGGRMRTKGWRWRRASSGPPSATAQWTRSCCAPTWPAWHPCC